MPQDQHQQPIWCCNESAGGQTSECFVLLCFAPCCTAHGRDVARDVLGGAVVLWGGRSAGNIPEANTRALDVHHTGAMDKD